MNFGKMWSSALTRELADPDSTRLFTDARRQQAIHDGMLLFADLSECSLRFSTVVCSHGVREYDLLSTVNVPGGDFLRLSKSGPEYHFTDTGGHVTYATGEDFPQRDINWLNQYQGGWRDSTGGTPSCFYERIDGGHRYFGFDTPPQIDAGESAKVVLPYLAKPSTMSASTDVPFTFTGAVRTDLEPYHPGVVHFGAYYLEKLRINDQGAQTQYQLGMSYVERFLRTMRKRGGNQVRQARNYFSDARRRRWTLSDAPISDPWGD